MKLLLVEDEEENIEMIVSQGVRNALDATSKVPTDTGASPIVVSWGTSDTQYWVRVSDAGRGSRAYILIKYDLGRNTDIWLRLAQTYYTDRQVVGSGLEEIDGNTRTEMKFQIRYKF